MDERQLDDEFEDEFSDETDAERDAREELDHDLDEVSQTFVNKLVDKLMTVAEKLSGHPWRNYQKPFAKRIFESVIIGDGATLTALYARQTGKSETVANAIATCMIMLPRLAKVFPALLDKFAEGVKVGAFAPVDEQADTLYGRIVGVLESENTAAILADMDINGFLIGKGRMKGIKFRGLNGEGSLVRKTTAHPRATIEGRTYHIILIDECFPAGTPVLTSEGWVDIDEIVNGDRRDWLVAAQGTDGIDWAPVTTGYKTRRHNELVRVDHEHGTFYATANHPIVVGSETIPAIRLRPGQNLSLVQGVAEPAKPDPEAVSSVNDRGLLQLAPGIPAKRYGEPGGTSEDVTNAEAHRASPYSPWREWDGTYAPARTPAESSGVGVDRRACNPYWKSDTRDDARQGHTGALQDRPSAAGYADSRGDRRRIACAAKAEGSGSTERFVVVESRVVSVAVLEPGSPEFDQFSDGADWVYTLEVDHPSHTYTAAGVVVGNCQGADDRVVNKSIGPMGAQFNATMVFTGTPTYTKNVFYDQITKNKREVVKRGRKRQCHFEVDWKTAAKENANYKRFVLKEMLRMGEDSDEFKLSYRLVWLLDKGMFTTSGKLDACGDTSMQEVLHAWTKTPVVVGIDPARIQDKTIVTVVWVDWDHPDELGYYHHRVLNWMDLEGDDWEEQYYKIAEFLSNYNVWKIGVDWGGVGDAVGQRLRLLMPHVEIVELGSAASEQSVRWKYLKELIDRRQVVWPAGARVRRLKMWRRFRQEMEDLEVQFKGPNMMAAAPNQKDAHDDYADSLSMATILTKEYQDEGTIEVYNNPFFSRKSLY